MSNLENPFKINKVDSTNPTDFRIPQLIELLENLRRFEITSSSLQTSPTSISIRAQEDDPLAIISDTKAYAEEEINETYFGIVEDVDYNSHEIYLNGNIDFPLESLLHFSIYAQRDDINAIIFCNSPLVLGMTAQFPTILNPAPNGSYNLTEQLLNYTETYSFVNIEHYGFVALGKSIKDVLVNVLKKLNLPEEALKEFY